MKIAVFPGSFDPITKGHLEIIERASGLFDKIIVAVGNNAGKQTMFSLSQRLEWIESVIASVPNATVESYEGLTVDFCAEKKANFILRGLRNTSDFEYEKVIGGANAKLNRKIETVLMFSSPEFSYLSSSIVRDIIRNKGKYQDFVPSQVII